MEVHGRAPLRGAWDKQDACMGDPERAGLAYKRTKAVVRSQDPEYGEKEKILEGYKNSASDLLKKGLP